MTRRCSTRVCLSRVLPFPSAKLILMVLMVGVQLALLPSGTSAGDSQGDSPPQIHAAAAVLVDWTTGEILYEKKAHDRRAPASTTKIMTALLAVELGDLSDEVVISRRAASTPGSSMGLRAGDRYSLREMLYGLMLPSGNDAAVAIAEHIAGSFESFVSLMNARATQLGLMNTHFRNPHGLTAPSHYSSAYDLAILTINALRNPTLAHLVKFARMSVCQDSGREKELYNTNQLLWSYRWADGVKTGTTSVAGRCLVSSATKDEHRLVAVVLRSGDRFGESRRLLDWGFETFALVTLARKDQWFDNVKVQGGMDPSIPVLPAGDLQVVVRRDQLGKFRQIVNLATNLHAPVAQGVVVGHLAATLDGRLLGKVDLVTARAVPRRTPIRLLIRFFLPLARLSLEHGIW